jgi:hypothetical protein
MTGGRIRERLSSVNKRYSSLGFDCDLPTINAGLDMTSHGPIESRPQRQRRVHAAMDAYVRWRDECNAVWDAYGRWKAAAETDAASAFQIYAAALDREEHASEVYAGLIQRAGDPLAPSKAAQATPRGRKSHVDAHI